MLTRTKLITGNSIIANASYRKNICPFAKSTLQTPSNTISVLSHLLDKLTMIMGIDATADCGSITVGPLPM